MKSKKVLPITMAIVIISFLFASCANKEIVDHCLTGQKFGFWHGLWHGIIAPVDFVLMFFRNDITIFAQNNNGIWYAFGFLIGSGGWGFMGGRSVRRKKSR